MEKCAGFPPTKTFPFGKAIYWFCEEHFKAGAEQVTGRIFRNAPEPKK
jgi:hypothetical protein